MKRYNRETLCNTCKVQFKNAENVFTAQHRRYEGLFVNVSFWNGERAEYGNAELIPETTLIKTPKGMSDFSIISVEEFTREYRIIGTPVHPTIELVSLLEHLRHMAEVIPVNKL